MRQNKKRPIRTVWVILLTISVLLSTAGCISFDLEQTGNQTTLAVRETIAPVTPPPIEEKYIVSSASIGVTGDMLMHMPILDACRSGGEYDFSRIFQHITPYYNRYDYMIANLEVTFGGIESGDYKGYPVFNCPDSLAEDLRDAGVDMVLTANNHAYDNRHIGFIRTLEVLDQVGLEHIGTRADKLRPFYMVKEINGIHIGMACYTYETTQQPYFGKKSLNGIPLSETDSGNVSSFRYWDLQSFYRTVEDDLSAMKAEGADVTIVFIHWGNEYKLFPNDYQQTIAQSLCDIGVDIIVGGHPHVIEPFETLVSSSGNKTYCLYSAGNAVSNQRRDLMRLNTGHTEDGIIFEAKLELWSDGSVSIGEIGALPTWVNKSWDNGKVYYQIIPLDPTLYPWEGFGVSDISELKCSYKRTMDLVGENINACRRTMGIYPLVLEIE